MKAKHLNVHVYIHVPLAVVTCAAYTSTCIENGNVVNMLIMQIFHGVNLPPSIPLSHYGGF